MTKSSVIALAVALIVLLTGLFLYRKFISGPGVPADLPDYHIVIPSNSDFETVVGLLHAKGFIPDEQIFRMLAERMDYERYPMRAGRYEIQPGWTAIELIRHLRSGPQSPVKVVLTTERLIENVAAKAARFLEPDSLEIWALFQDEAYLDSIGYNQDDLMTLFIPNTYEFFWNTTPRSFMARMIKEHEAFWSKDGRRAKAEAQGLSPKEVYTLASIVEKESLRSEERPRIAGVYLNRLRIGMRLQADPTSVFATRDFEATRVTYYHTKFDSPYNTYMYAGLPPGPIAMPSIGSIDAVLNPEEHEYIFFCAVGDGSGLHAFAKTLAAHNENAARYRENLKRRGLR